MHWFYNNMFRAKKAIVIWGVFWCAVCGHVYAFEDNSTTEEENIKGVVYSKEGKIVFQSKKARFDKGKIIMNDNVKIETEKGVSLETDALLWDKEHDVVQSDKEVNIKKNDGFTVKGRKLKASAGLKKASLKQDVVVTIPAEKGKTDFIMITCDGPLEMDYEKGQAVFYNNVKVSQKDSQLYSDKATMYFDMKNKKLVKIVAEGNVRIIRGKNTSFSQKATFFASNRKIVLEGRPRLVVFPQEGLGGSFGGSK